MAPMAGRVSTAKVRSGKGSPHTCQNADWCTAVLSVSLRARRNRQMLNKHLLLFALLFLATFSPSPAAAGATDTSTSAQRAADVDTDEKALRRFLELFRAAQVSLSQAMMIAEALHTDSRTTEISFEASASSAYRVKTVKNDQVWENTIDAKTGGITRNEIVSSVKDLTSEDQDNTISLQSVQQQLLDAVRVAENVASGKAISGAMVNEDGRLNFVVVVLNGDRLKQVVLELPRRSRRGSGFRRPDSVTR